MYNLKGRTKPTRVGMGGTESSELLSSYDKILKAKFLNKVLIEPLPFE